MVSKPTGRPRGRPRKEPPAPAPKRRKGCPDIALRDDPDRYALAFIEAHKRAFGMSDRAAALRVAAFFVGNELLSAECAAGMELRIWGPQEINRADGLLKNTKAKSGNAVTMEGRAKTLREKATKWRADPQRQVWLHCMDVALTYALMPQIPIHRAKMGAFLTALRVGEEHFATDTILPMIELSRAEIPAPDFSSIFPPTQQQSE